MLKTQTRNRDMCRKCRYRGGRLSEKVAIFCDYSGKTGATCLRLEHGKVVDKRGDDLEDCKLFDDGKVRDNPMKKLWRG